MKKLKNTKGSTLIEMLLVLVAIAILSQTVFYVMFQSYRTFQREGFEINRTHEIQVVMNNLVEIARRSAEIDSLDPVENNTVTLKTENNHYRIIFDDMNEILTESSKPVGVSDFSTPRTLLEDVTGFVVTYNNGMLNFVLTVTGEEGRVFTLETQVVNRNTIDN